MANTTNPLVSPPANQVTSSPVTSGNEKVITLQAGSFFFKPNEIRVKKGDTLKIILQANDMMHNFVIDDLNISSPIVKAGETSEISFTASQVGEFEYYCGVGNHKQMGQKGKLIIED